MRWREAKPGQLSGTTEEDGQRDGHPPCLQVILLLVKKENRRETDLGLSRMPFKPSLLSAGRRSLLESCGFKTSGWWLSVTGGRRWEIKIISIKLFSF